MEKKTELEKPESMPKDKKRLVPESQIDYNIITNEVMDDIYYKTVDKKPKKQVYQIFLRKTQWITFFIFQNNNLKKLDGKQKDFNIVSNRYLDAHEEKAQVRLK